MPVGTDELLAELNLLMEDAVPPPEDLHELHFRVLEIIKELEAMGEPIPDDIARFERELREEIARVGAEEARGARKRDKNSAAHDTGTDEHRQAAGNAPPAESRHTKAK
jgi:hypothetical protein